MCVCVCVCIKCKYGRKMLPQEIHRVLEFQQMHIYTCI